MITGLQASQLRTAVKLHDARNTLLDLVYLALWSDDDRQALREAIEAVDSLFAKVIPK